jgi:hypothetical protein
MLAGGECRGREADARHAARRQGRQRSGRRRRPRRQLELAEQAVALGDAAANWKRGSPPIPRIIRRASTSPWRSTPRRPRGCHRPSPRNHQARPQLERRRRAQAARAVLRGLGTDGRGDPCRAAAGCPRSCSPEASLRGGGREGGMNCRLSRFPRTCRRRSRSFRCRARCCCRAARCRSTSSSRATSPWSTTR